VEGVQQVRTGGTFVGTNMNLAGNGNITGAGNIDGPVNTYNGLNVYRNGGGGIPTVFITSAGVISAGGPSGIIYARNIHASEYLYVDDGYAVFNSELFVTDRSQFRTRIELLDWTTNEQSITLTSAGVISAGGIDGAVYARTVGVEETLNAGYATIWNDLEVQNNLNVIGEANFVDYVLVNQALNVSGAFKAANSVQIDVGNLVLNTNAGGIRAKTSIVNASGAGATTLTAACGDAMCGRVSINGGSGYANIMCTLQTTKASSTAIIIVTPIGQSVACDNILSVDQASIVEGVSFRVRSTGSGSVYGFYFLIIEQS
jgi:hypothetical protein